MKAPDAARLASAALPRTVLVLGCVSFLNDAASEMIAPLLPVFLTAVLGAGPAAVGLVEGLAEATSSVLKLLSGRLADRGWSARGLVLGGYGLSNAARPLVALALSWPVVLALRFADRVGKGLRTAPRDALLAAAASEGRRGRAFGFHRSMDHAGAVVGPLAAFALLQGGLSLPGVFLASAVPGAAVLVLLAVGLPAAPAPGPVPAPAAPPPRPGWKGLDRRLKALVLSVGGLALASAPEAFLVLWVTERGADLLWVPLLWAAAHAVKSMVSAPSGALSDRWGRLPVMLWGWGTRVAVLVLLATASDGPWLDAALFLAWAAVLAVTEPAEKALVGDFAPPGSKATAFGLYHLVGGVLALPGALLFGILWQAFGAAAAFLAAAALTAVSAAVLAASARPRRV